MPDPVWEVCAIASGVGGFIAAISAFRPAGALIDVFASLCDCISCRLFLPEPLLRLAATSATDYAKSDIPQFCGLFRRTGSRNPGVPIHPLKRQPTLGFLVPKNYFRGPIPRERREPIRTCALRELGITGSRCTRLIPMRFNEVTSRAKCALIRRCYRNDDATSTKRVVFYDTFFTLGGCHVPWPAGRIDGGVGFGQYSRITR